MHRLDQQAASLDGTMPARLEPLSIVLFGPPGSGKTSVGRALARRLGRSFVDTDDLVKQRTGLSANAVISRHGEPAFRQWERVICAELEGQPGLIIASGGGTLLDAANRRALEAAGLVVFLDCGAATLRQRIAQSDERPLLVGPGYADIEALLDEREQIYRSFSLRVRTDDVGIEVAADRVRETLASRVFRRRVKQGNGYMVNLGHGILQDLADQIVSPRPSGRLAVVSDSNVSRLHAARLAVSLEAPLVTFPAGEQSKSLSVALSLYNAFLEHGLDRHSTVIAIGGGVVTDLAGYAAATFMRGIPWIALPTTLLGMVDASLGGKVGVNLPEAKNLIGAFHPPADVWADLDMLATLPDRTFRSGLAEVVKAAVIGDPELFSWLEQGTSRPTQRWLERAITVKADLVERDPDDLGVRQVLNFGHTLGHAFESASHFQLSHGEAISAGMVAETHIAETMGLAEAGLADRIASALSRVGLPTSPGPLDADLARQALRRDKKHAQGLLTFCLPSRIGRVQFGLTVPEAILEQQLLSLKEVA